MSALYAIAKSILRWAWQTRVHLFVLIPVAVILLPNIGLFVLTLRPDHSLVSGTITVAPLALYTVFSATALASFLVFWRLDAFALGAPAAMAVRSLPNLVTLSLASLMLVGVLTQIDVMALAAGEIYKGDLRVGGQALSIMVKFVLPSVFAYVCISYRFGDGTRLWVVALVGALAFSAGAMLGTKAAPVLVLLPGVLVLCWRGMRLPVLVAAGTAAVLIMVVAATVFDTGGDTAEAVSYFWRRLSLLTAEVPYRITQGYMQGTLDINYPETLIGVVTNTILRLVTGDPDGIYRFNLSTAVSAALYPERIPLINSGEWNQTPSVYVEGLVALGPLYALLACATAAFGAGLFTVIRNAIREGRHFFASVAMTYFVFVYLAWLNSAGITGLVHPFPLLALALTWALLRICGWGTARLMARL